MNGRWQSWVFVSFLSPLFITAAGGLASYLSARSSMQPNGLTEGSATSVRGSIQLIAPKDVLHIPIPSSYFGMTVNELKNWPMVPFGALGHSPGFGGYWPFVEPRKRQYDWRELDHRVEAAESHGIDFFFTNDFVPQWAAVDKNDCVPAGRDRSVLKCRSNVSNIQDWDDFVTALVTRYKGRIKIYELWNEPYGKDFWSGTMTEMVILNQHMLKIIRELDPDAVVISPQPRPLGWLDQYLAAGGPRSVDVMSLHGYTTNRKLDTAEVSYALKAPDFRETLEKYGLSNKPMWDTEGSWGTIEDDWVVHDRDLQAAFVARAYLLHWSAGFSRFYWYAWDEPNWGTLWNPREGILKPGVAYAQVYKWMVGATMIRACSQQGDTRTCGFTRPGGYLAEAVWITSGSKSYPVASQYTQYRDLDGRTVRVNGGSVQIGPKPILLENLSPQ